MIKNTWIVLLTSGRYVPIHELFNGTFTLASETVINGYSVVTYEVAHNLIYPPPPPPPPPAP